jgi:hypothetical protein
LFRILLTSRYPPSDLPWSATSTSFIQLHGMTFSGALVRPCSLTGISLGYIGFCRCCDSSVLPFRYPVPIFHSTGPTLWPSSYSLLEAIWSPRLVAACLSLSFLAVSSFLSVWSSRSAMANWRPAAGFTPAPTKSQVYFLKILTSQL